MREPGEARRSESGGGTGRKMLCTQWSVVDDTRGRCTTCVQMFAIHRTQRQKLDDVIQHMMVVSRDAKPIARVLKKYGGGGSKKPIKSLLRLAFDSPPIDARGYIRKTTSRAI